MVLHAQRSPALMVVMSLLPDWPNEEVRRLHAAVSTPASTLVMLVRKAVKVEPIDLERIVDGYGNEVYRAHTRSRGDVVIRIARFGGTQTQVQFEARAIELARAADVPVAELLLIDTVQIDGQDFPVMVQTAVRGSSFRALYPELSRSQRDSVLSQTGQLIARLNTVPGDTDWKVSTALEVEKRRNEADNFLSAGFSRTELDTMIDALENYAVDSAGLPVTLCHGDLGPQHIYLDDDLSISGIIDFGDAAPGWRPHDLAVLRVRAPHLDIEPVLHGHGTAADADFRRALDLHTLLMALATLTFGIREHDHRLVDRATNQVRSLTAVVTQLS